MLNCEARATTSTPLYLFDREVGVLRIDQAAVFEALREDERVHWSKKDRADADLGRISDENIAKCVERFIAEISEWRDVLNYIYEDAVLVAAEVNKGGAETLALLRQGGLERMASRRVRRALEAIVVAEQVRKDYMQSPRYKALIDDEQPERLYDTRVTSAQAQRAVARACDQAR